MSLDVSHTIDSIQEGTKEVAETAHTKTSEFHEKYVSKVVPDCGKYGDAAKFVVEMAPGVAEYNAIREGDWQEFAISAGIDVAAAGIGLLTAGAGYGAVKGGSIAAKAGAKTAAREIAEAGAKKAVKELAEEGAEKVVKEAAEAGAKKAVKELAEEGAEKAVKEAAEAGAEKAAKELAEAGAEKAAREVAEAGAEKAAKEVAEAGAEKAAKEVTEAGAEKAAKEVAEAGTEKAAKEVTEAGAEKAAKEATEEGAEKATKEVAETGTETAVKEVDESSIIRKNKLDGTAREETVLNNLDSYYGKENVLREQLLRDASGKPIKDLKTNTARRIDFIVIQNDKIIRSIEVTSQTADKTAQMAKESRILEEAAKNGGAYIKNIDTGKLIEFPIGLGTEIRRLP